MHTYPWHVGDYLKDCAHLTDDEDLAYRRLLDLYYTQEGPIPDTQQVTRRIRMASKKEVVRRVLLEFFERRDGFWYQKRADEEIARYQKRSEVSRSNGAKSQGRPKDKPAGLPAGPQQGLTRTRTRTINTPLPPEGEAAWAAFWQAYPRKEKKPDALRAFAKALAKATPEAIMAGLQRYLHCQQWTDPTKVPHPATWLNGEQWNDSPPAAPGAAGDDPKAWWLSQSGILAKAVELALPGPPATSGGVWLEYVASVWLAAGDGPWINERDDLVYPRYVKLRNG